MDLKITLRKYSSVSILFIKILSFHWLSAALCLALCNMIFYINSFKSNDNHLSDDETEVWEAKWIIQSQPASSRDPSLNSGLSNTKALLLAPWPYNAFTFFKFVFYLFLAALGLHCCAEREGATLPFSARASHCGGFSCCGARALGTRASVVVARGLSSCGSWAVERRLSSCGARA